MAKSKALVPFNVLSLPAKAAELKLVLDIDGEQLKAEVEQFTNDIATRELGAKQLTITDEATNQRAADMRGDFARRAKGLQEIVDRLKTPVNSVRAVILEMEHAVVDREEAGKKLLTDKMEKYELSRRAAERATNEAFSRIATQERGKLQDEADELLAMGHVKESDALRQQAQMIVAPTVVGGEKPTGIRTGDKFTGKVTDIIAFAKAIVEGKIPLLHEVKGEQRQILVVDQVVLNAVVSRQQNSLDWPGVVVEEGVRIGSTKIA